MFANRPFYRHGAAGILAILTLIAITPPLHAAVDMFEVRDVPVDATAESAAAARDQALADGQREAFYRLLNRLTLAEHHHLLPNLDAAAISTYVRDFSVSGEKTSNVRYLARVHVRFKEPDIRSLLNEFGLPFAETPSKPALILPVLKRGSQAALWRDPNPWRQAWSTKPLPTAPVPLLMPVGDLDDIGSVTVEQAMAGDLVALSRIAARYGAGAAIVARADLAAIGAPHIDLIVTRVSVTGETSTVTRRVEAASGETVDTVLGRATDEAARMIEEDWKQKNLMRFDEGGILAVTVPLQSLDHWLDVRQRLRGIAVIDRTELILLSREEALLNIHYLGTTSQLSRALAQSDLILVESQGVWSLTTAAQQGAAQLQ